MLSQRMRSNNEAIAVVVMRRVNDMANRPIVTIRNISAQQPSSPAVYGCRLRPIVYHGQLNFLFHLINIYSPIKYYRATVSIYIQRIL